MELTDAQATIRTLLLIAALLPLISAVIIIFFGKKKLPGNKTGIFTTGMLAAAFVCSVVSWLTWTGASEDGPVVWNVKWLPVQSMDRTKISSSKLVGDKIEGQVYIDYNENGKKDKTEPWAGGRTVYLDNGSYDAVMAGDTETNHAAETDADGKFSLSFTGVQSAGSVNAGRAQVKKEAWLYLGIMADGLTLAMMVMVTFISTLVHIYSIGYMKGDKRFERFFAYLSLFTFSMLGIVLANSIMQLFVFWELVGLTSYLLIGFWFEKRGPQLACKKAFVMNRIGDAGFLVGFGILFYKLGANVLLPGSEAGTGVTGMFGAIQTVIAAEGYSITENPPMWLTIAGIGLFFGAIGKSAQFPLHTWLPDAMEGPTPVSSIVHSATMVAAGVYLTARLYPILTPGAHLFIATIGLITLVMAALMAMVMTDIKRVLAYSTLSQLGYMILGLGTGAWFFAVFHLITHAFFKCCLFQCSGSVINSMHHEQEMTKYGGLMKKMPKTALAYGICTLTISGLGIGSLSLFSGFYSKDGIIAGAGNYGTEMIESLGVWANLFWLGPVAVAYITPFYMARSFFLTFCGKPRDQHAYDHAEEAPATMWGPQLVLAAMAILACPWILFFDDLIMQTDAGMKTLGGGEAVHAQSADMHELGHGMHMAHNYLLYGLAGLLPIALAFFIYGKGLAKGEKLASLPVLKQLHILFRNKFYFDALYDNFVVNLSKIVASVLSLFDKYIVDGIVNLVGVIAKLVSNITGKVDKEIVDGTVDGAASFAWSLGGIMRTSHAGKIRTYVMVLLGSACFITLMVIAIAIVNK
jgi:NADH-quinone oxidoreductase subunit L